MQWFLALIALLVLVLTGCYSVPVEDLSPAATEPPLSAADIDRLSRAGLSDEVVQETVERRGIAELGEPELEKPACRTELVIPWWPFYTGGRWRWGVRIEAATSSRASRGTGRSRATGAPGRRPG
jgi:hypothetical protein